MADSAGISFVQLKRRDAMFYQKALKFSDILTERINALERKLETLPVGNMFITHNGKYLKWYYREKPNAKEKYIAKDERELAEKFAQKKYLEILKGDLEHERKAMNFYLRHHKLRPWKSDDFLTESPEYRELLRPFLKPKSQELDEWANAPFESNPNYPEQLKYKMPNGKYARSKSEALIAMILFNNRIPFRYECALKVGDITIYPDFTIRHPKTGKYYYFEHFGMIDVYSYRQKALNKLDTLIPYGIIPTVNLITTFETQEHPLDIEYVEHLVKEYFL